MSRQEKGSRVRMLPPRLQLQQRDAHTGSYPTVSRFSTDGRSGVYNTSFNDTKTIIFTSSNDYTPGIGFSAGSVWLIDCNKEDIATTSSIVIVAPWTDDLISFPQPGIYGEIGTNLAVGLGYIGDYPIAGPYNLHLQSADTLTNEYVVVDHVGFTFPYGAPLMTFFLEENLINNFILGSDIAIATTGTPSTVLSPASIITTGNLRSQVIEGLPFVHFSPGQEPTPFRDHGQAATDGKSSNNPFFTTGSADLLVGGGFSSPLWSKNKIEIDISVPVECGSTLFVSGYSYGLGEPAQASMSGSHEMLYYNFALKKWEGLGQGLSYGAYHEADLSPLPRDIFYNAPFENHAMFGFAPGIVNMFGWDLLTDSFFNQVTGSFENEAAAGTPITNFGFPYHPKFHATSSQTCNMSQYINAPFLVEKIVVELSAAYTITADVYNTASYLDGNGAPPGVVISSIYETTVPASINNFFILNQRKQNKFSHSEEIINAKKYDMSSVPASQISCSVPTSMKLSKNGPNVYINTLRDLITWGGISSFANNMPTTATRSGMPAWCLSPIDTLSANPKALMTRDCVFSSSTDAINDLTPLSWNGKVYMELSAKSPKKFDPNSTLKIGSSLFAMQSGDVYQAYVLTHYAGGGRNALGITVPNGRNYISTIADVQKKSEYTSLFGTQWLLEESDTYLYNPYILMPDDQLVFGWQQPLIAQIRSNSATPAWDEISTFRNISTGSFSTISFLPGEAKVTLYGSYISNDKEHNDGTNQLLSSDSVHETIGES